MDFDQVADELYALPLAEFTSTRNARAHEAKAAGNPPLAKQVQALRKPTMAAWLVNQLVRRHRDELTVLFELGAELRAGISGLTGDELRLLTKRRYQLISALVQQTLSIAEGQRISNEVAGAVRETLESTLSDAVSAMTVQSGRLSDTLRVSGFGAGLGIPADAVPGGQPDAGDGGNVVDMAEHRDRRALAREQAETRVEAAEGESEKAAARLEEAEAQLKAAEESQQETAVRVRRLQEELTRASTELDKRAEAAERKRGHRDDAATDAQEAEYDLADAREALRRLNG